MEEAALIKEVGCARSSVRTLIYLGIAYTTKENNFTLGLFFPARGGWEEQWASLYSETGNASPHRVCLPLTVLVFKY